LNRDQQDGGVAVTRQEIEALLEQATDEQRQGILTLLRTRYRLSIHPLESNWGTTAEAILQAIHEAPDLTQRGVRGVLAEAIFRTEVVPQQLPEWTNLPTHNDEAFDLLLERDGQRAKVQVKNQRKAKGIPEVWKKQQDIFIVETQRTRNGKRADGEDSRPYRFGEFDVLAVCLQPSSGSWTDFIFCAQKRLLPRPTNHSLLAVKQPIYTGGQNGWTRSFEEAVNEALAKKA
jgi:hypothetical protein